MASDVQKVEDLNDHEQNLSIEQDSNQQKISDNEEPLINNINNLNLDSDQVRCVKVFFKNKLEFFYSIEYNINMSESDSC